MFIWAHGSGIYSFMEEASSVWWELAAASHGTALLRKQRMLGFVRGGADKNPGPHTSDPALLGRPHLQKAPQSPPKVPLAADKAFKTHDLWDTQSCVSLGQEDSYQRTENILLICSGIWLLPIAG